MVSRGGADNKHVRNFGLSGAAALSVQLLALVVTAHACFMGNLEREAYDFCIQLAPTYAMHVRTANGTLTVGLELQSSIPAWFGWGVSESGSMKGADIVVVESSKGGALTLTDMHATGFQRPVADASQDAHLVSASTSGGLTTVVFTRPLVPCDAEGDLPIQAGVPHQVIWAIGAAPTLSYHGSTQRGMRTIVLQSLPVCGAGGGAAAADAKCSLFAPGAAPDTLTLDTGGSSLEILMAPSFQVPVRDTTYACKLVFLPSDVKYHMTAYEGVATPYLHHMVLFRCPPGGLDSATDAQRAGQPWDCTDTGPVCQEYVLTWAPGVGVQTLPPQAGFPFGKGEPSLFLLNLHYNNPNQDAGVVDSSGFRVAYTPKLRPSDMGVLTLGTTGFSLAPGRASVSLAPSLCPASCTLRLPPGGITVASTVLHMHQTGARMVTQHMRGTQELPPIAAINSFDFNYNAMHAPVPATRQVLPGDQLITTCTYNTTSRTSTTYFGLGSHDEMCFSYVMYYPRLNFSSCLSLGVGQQPLGIVLCGAEDTARATFASQGAIKGALKGLAERWLVPLPFMSARTNYTAYQSQCTPARAGSAAAVAKTAVLRRTAGGRR